ncbi:MAG: thiamine pyrophosphate-dependent enzyme, partial [Pseudomonadota bacterium]
NNDHLHEVKTHLERARAPMIIVGGGHKGGGSMVVEVADNTGAALFTTYAGRGLVPDDHPRHFGAMLARPDSAEILRRADLLIIVGSEMSQGDLWRDDPGFDGTVMRIDIDAQSLTDSMGAEYIYKYDAGLFMAGLAHATRDCTPAVKWRPAEVAATRARWREQVQAERPGIVDVADAVRAATPKDAMIYSDMTQFAYAAKEIWPMTHPHHWHHPTGFGTLGYALPAAIGGAVARKGQPTMAIIGDYGFHYTMAELGVAVELNLPLPIILWDNGKLKEIEDSMIAAQIQPNAVVARNPDFCKLAKAFGAHAAAPQSLNDMQNDVRTAFDANGPTLIYVTPTSRLLLTENTTGSGAAPQSHATSHLGPLCVVHPAPRLGGDIGRAAGFRGVDDQEPHGFARTARAAVFAARRVRPPLALKPDGRFGHAGRCGHGHHQRSPKGHGLEQRFEHHDNSIH